MIPPLDHVAFLARLDTEAAAREAAAPQPPPANGHAGNGNGRAPAPGKGVDALARYCERALQEELARLEAAPDGTRNDALNRAAFAVGQLVAAGGLDRARVEADLAEAARRVGLGDAEIAATLRSGLDKGSAAPRDLTHVGLPPGGGRDGAVRTNGAAPAAHRPHDRPAVPDGDAACPPGLEANPERLARLFLAERYYHPDGHALRYWQGLFYGWARGAYRAVDKAEIRAEVTRVVAHEFLRLYNLEMMRFGVRQATGQGGGAGDGGGGGGDRPPRLLPVSTTLVGDVLQAIGSLALVRGEACRDMPSWVDPPGGRDVRADWPAAEVLPAANALVHLPSLVAGREATIRPTPAYFGSYALDYAFDAAAPSPTNWLTFLGKVAVTDESPVRLQLWPDDPESIDFLQEWFGYHLARTSRQQKALALIGPRRSGKGTIAFILGAMIGQENVAGPTLSSLGTQFGLATLIGKPAAIIDDARLSGKTDVAVLVERLLSIIGEGQLDVDRKNLPQWTGRLAAKFTIITNETPRLPDASSAIASRLLFLHLTRSFYGREDPELKAKLLPELPGILNWAIEGWHRLHARGRFVQPESGKGLAAEMEEMGSPIATFLRERCVRGPGHRVRCDHLYAEWRSWCTEKGYESPGNDAVFGRNIRTVYAEIEKTRNHVDDADGPGKRYHYSGLRLRTWGDPDQDEPEDGPGPDPGPLLGPGPDPGRRPDRTPVPLLGPSEGEGR